MRERPIIFNTENVRAILEGRKPQTRRVIKLKNYHRNVWGHCVPHNGARAELLGEPYLKVPYDAITDNAGNRITCPYGQAGDRLWVRETWATSLRIDHMKPSDIGEAFYVPLWYKADNEVPKEGEPLKGKWRPSIFMPRWASRITLLITDVRVERLQEITRDDALAEGCLFEDLLHHKEPKINLEIKWYRQLWDSLNAKRGYGWETNPWVWVIEFIKP